MLSDHIDVPKYRGSTPIKLRRLGVVRDARPRHHEIQWDNGRSQRVALEQMPPEFATYRPGQPFEAVVVYDPLTMNFQCVETVFRRGADPRLSRDERRRIWEEMSTSAELPGTKWA